VSDVPAGEVYRGPPGIARDSVWLTNEDIPHDRDTVVTIESIVLHKKLTFQGGRDKNNGLSATFIGKARRLLLNATNRKILAALYGATAGDWFGKQVALYVEQDVRRPDGTRGPAVRIRPKRFDVPAGKTAAPKSAPVVAGFDRAAALRDLATDAIQAEVGKAREALDIHGHLDTLSDEQLDALVSAVWPN
jgi:hypothetical protein